VRRYPYVMHILFSPLLVSADAAAEEEEEEAAL
jgi:hypothetical protein